MVKVLDHFQAVETHAVERYLLGELSASEKRAFERHYFECPECALAIESGEEFIANARAVFKEAEQEPERALLRNKPVERRSSFRDFMAAWMRPGFALTVAASVLFGLIALYQGAVLIPGLRQTPDTVRRLPAFYLGAASRGETTVIKVPAGSVSFSLSLDLPPDSHFGQYICDLSGSGIGFPRVPVPAPNAGQPITISVPVKGIKPGSYQLTVFGAEPNGRQADKITTATFDLQFSE